MAYEVVMPQLGLSMDSGRIIRWLKKTGESVRKGESLLEVESDKATIEVEAVDSGILYITSASTEEDIPVGSVIGFICAPDETPPVDSSISTAGGGEASQTPIGSETKGGVVSAPHGYVYPDRPPSSPAARRLARELNVEWQLAVGTGPDGRIKARDVKHLAQNYRSEVPRLNATPLARRLADHIGLDVESVQQRFPKERIRRQHVEAVAREIIQARTQQPSLSREGTDSEPERQSMSSVRRRIAQRMTRSSQTTAPVTLTTEVNATQLVHLRQALSGEDALGSAPDYNVLLAKLCAGALKSFPEINGYVDGDDIVRYPAVHIGIAVDTAKGLIVPVVRNVAEKSLRVLIGETAHLLARAGDGKARPEELRGSTFTITNLGMYGIDHFTPIINVAEGAILGVGRLQNKVVVGEDDRPVVQMRLPLSLTFDHRLLDGAPAARFLARVGQYVEQPYLWLA